MEHAVGVDREHPAPLRVVDLVDRTHLQHAGNADAEPHRPQRGLCPADQRIHCTGIADVQRPGMQVRGRRQRGRSQVGGDHHASAVQQELHQRCADAPLLTHAELQACLDTYLADPEQRQNPLALPLAASDFVGLAPAFVAAAEFDPLRDDAARYAERLFNR